MAEARHHVLRHLVEMSELPPLLSDPTFQVLVESPAEITGLVSADGRIVYVSPSIEEVLGFEPQEKIGVPSLGGVHPDDRERIGETLTRLLASPGDSVQVEYRVRHKDGSWRVLNTTGWNLLEDERVGAVLLRSRDVTESRKLEDRLGRTERRLERLLGSVPVVIFSLDADGTFRLSKGKGLEALGLEPGEVVGHSVFDLYAQYPDVVDAAGRALEGEEVRSELRVEGRVYETLFTPRVDPDGEVVSVSGVSLDRTEEVRAREADAFKARLLDSVGQAVIVTDLEGRITYWNRAATEIYGWERHEAMGRSVMEMTVPDDAEVEASEIFAALRTGATWSGEFQVRRKDGTTFPALVTDAPLLDEEGELVGVIGVSVDLTEQRALEARLEDTRRIEAIGRLAGGVAHDFNNMVTAIRGYASLLLEELTEEDEQLRLDVEEIDRTAERAARLTSQLLAYSRRQVSQPDHLDLVELVGSMGDTLDRLIGDDIRLTVETDSGPCPVEIDPAQVEQVVLNLAVNARDAMPRGGELEIRVRPVDLGAARVRELGCGRAAGGYVELTVRDTGSGIPEEDLPHVFEPFFTTKPRGVGTGLGLATVYGVVKQNEGCLHVDSGWGEGATFRIYLPRREGEEGPEPGSDPGEDVWDVAAAAGRTVLVADDDPAVRHVIGRALRRGGYRVLEAQDGLEALELIDAEAAPPHVLVVDVVMPGLGGHELAERVRESHPRLPVLLISGYTDDEVARRGIETGRYPFLRKPFTPAEMVRRVRELDGGSA